MSWDVDGNGNLDALTDGKLVLGYLFGFTGEALIRNSLAPDATRTEAAQIIAYLESIRDQLDVDGNGEIDALTDAILYLRYLFGFTGESLISGAVGAGATRDGAEQVIAYLESIPNNDNFANAEEISGVPITSTSQNVLATLEVGEPNHAGNTGGSSVWWSWTAPENGSVTITTAGSDFDTVLGVYTGNYLSSLTEIASNDDSEGLTSSVTFNAVAGEDYKIAVDGFGGAIGNINLNIASASASNNPPIALDDFASTQENSSVTIAVLDNDFDLESDLISLTGVDSSGNGSVRISNNQVIYTPDADFAGTDSFRYTISDAQDTDTATVTVTVESSAIGDAQIITPVSSTQSASANQGVSIDVQYSTNPANSPTSAMGLRLHWDSTKLSFVSRENVLRDDLLSEGIPFEDTDDFDGDPNTDRFIITSWADITGGSWPNDPSSLPISLYRANFTTESDFADSTTINFSASSTAFGFDFSSTSATIDAIDGNDKIITPVPLTQSASANQGVSIDVQYSTNPANSATSGMGLRLHWDSTKLSFNSLANVLSDGLLAQGVVKNSWYGEDLVGCGRSLRRGYLSIYVIISYMWDI